jgi:hypothetical protein
MIPYFKKVNLALVAVCILISSLFFFRPPGNGLTRTQIAQIQSDIQLEGVAKLILDYRGKHGGTSPQQLSEIVPKDKLESQKSGNRLIDHYVLNPVADYGLPLKSNSSILVFEKPGLWSDGSVAVCYSNLTVKRLTVTEFSALGLEQ